MLTIFAALPLVVALASYIAKINLNYSLDLSGLTAIVMEWHPSSLLVSTSQKFLLLRENKSVPCSSASLEAIDSITFVPDTLS